MYYKDYLHKAKEAIETMVKNLNFKQENIAHDLKQLEFNISAPTISKIKKQLIDEKGVGEDTLRGFVESSDKLLANKGYHYDMDTKKYINKFFNKIGTLSGTYEAYYLSFDTSKIYKGILQIFPDGQIEINHTIFKYKGDAMIYLDDFFTLIIKTCINEQGIEYAFYSYAIFDVGAYIKQNLFFDRIVGITSTVSIGKKLTQTIYVLIRVNDDNINSLQAKEISVNGNEFNQLNKDRNGLGDFLLLFGKHQVVDFPVNLDFKKFNKI